jgi:hypothetical protein
LDDEGWNGDEALRLDPVHELPPRLVRPGAAAEEAVGGEARHLRLGEERALGIAVDDELPAVAVAGPEPAGERVVVDEHRGESRPQRVGADRRARGEDVEVLDGEAEEALVVQVGEVQRAAWRGLARAHRRRRFDAGVQALGGDLRLQFLHVGRLGLALLVMRI